MGWCSGTEIFDMMCESLLSDTPRSKKELLTELVGILEYMDWDCQQDSIFWDNPIVQEVMRELHPGWFDEESCERL